MKLAAVTLFVMLPPIACFVGATVLAMHDKDGWGWLIFAGILCADRKVYWH